MAKIRSEQTAAEARASVIRMMARDPDHLAHSYCLAAQLVGDAELKRKPNSVHLDVPAFFLIRHAVELAFKDILWMHHENEVSQNRLDEATGKPKTAKPLTEKEQARLGSTHNLDVLLNLTTKYLKGYMTPTWKRLVGAIVKIEGRYVDWSRFDEAKVDEEAIRAQRPRWHYRFDRPLNLPLKSLLADLAIFLKQAALLNWKDLDAQDPKDWSALQDLALTGDYLGKELMALGLD